VGEGAAAGLKADQLVKQLGLRWPDIIAVERAPTTIAADGGEISWRAMLSFGASTSRRSAPRATAWTTSNGVALAIEPSRSDHRVVGVTG
jgi:hypothetical protein